MERVRPHASFGVLIMTTLRDLFYGIAIVILVLICAALGMNLEDE